LITINHLSNDIAAGDWLPTIYAERIRTLRTRACSLDIPAKQNKTEILHTLLGIELRVGRRRFACPDLATARYMLVFARLGCREFAIPYDITKISTLADELETAWQRMCLALETRSRGQTDAARGRARSQLLKSIRAEIAEIGPGEKMPEFKQSTKRRHP
jgi:hypothetical protein